MCISFAVRCLVGGVLMKMGQAIILTWGKCNIYYFSHYRQSDPTLSIQYNTLPIAVNAVPLAIFTLLSMRLARKIGFGVYIRIVALFQSACFILSFAMPTYLCFVLFFVILPGDCFSLLLYPVLNCVWSYYPKSEGKVSGFLMGMSSLAIIGYVLLITYLSNPNNEQAPLTGHAGKTDFKYFDHSVAQNVPKAVLAASITSSLLLIIGSLLITHKEETITEEEKKLEKDTKEVELSSQANQDGAEKHPVQADQEADTDLSAPAGLSDMKLMEQKNIPQLQGAVRRAVLSTQFLILFFSQFAIYFFIITISSNYKTYALSKYNNDHYITLVDLLSQFIGGGVSFVWGYLSDRITFTWLYCGLIISTGVFGVLVALTTGPTNFTTFFIFYIIFIKGSILVINPGLVKIYNHDLGTKLLTVLNISAIVAFFCGPVFQWAAQDLLEFDYILAIEGMTIILSGALVSRLRMSYSDPDQA